MRTDVSVSGQSVLAVVLGDVESALQHPVQKIHLAIEKGQYGHKEVTKDFLMPGNNGTRVKRDVNSRCRKCDTIILSKVDALPCEQLKRGKYTFLLRFVVISQCSQVYCMSTL